MAVFGLVSAVAGFVKVRYLIDKAIIDNIVFRCHYRITSAILFVCCIIVTANNLIGDPISCINDGSIPTHVINTYCWITYTFTLPGTTHLSPMHPSHYGLDSKTAAQHYTGSEVAFPGSGNESGEEKRFHSYYQWVPFMLFFQGILFYMPHWIWKNWEEGKVRMISDGMRGVQIQTRREGGGRHQRLVRYLLETLHMHNGYSFGYFFCEFLNFVNVVGNIFFVDLFLGGAFLTYGTDVIRFSGMNQENRSDPMVQVFPRLTKCTFHKFGSSGTIQKHDALCVLALNILNEKIYIFLWFWFIILAVLSGCALVYSAAVVMMPTTREFILKRRFRFNSMQHVETLIRKTQVGDFLLLHLLGQNMNIVLFGEVLNEFARNLHSPNGGGHSPSAPSTLEMSPIYPTIEKPGKETET